MFNKNVFQTLYIHLMLIGIFFIGITSSKVYGMDISEYYPLQVGNVWSYSEMIGMEGPEIEKEYVLSSVQYDNTEVYLLGELELDSGGWGTEFEGLAWDNDGLKLFGEVDCEDGVANTSIYEPPILFFPRNMEIGKSKQWSYNGMQFEAKVIGKESVSVPAGTFDSLKVYSKSEDDEESEECTSWLVKSCGSVKEECSFEENGEVEEEKTELIAAIVDGELIGNPLEQDEVITFDLATASASGCGLLVENIVLQGQNGPELWWAEFVFDTNSVKWILNNVGQGTAGNVPDQQCNIPELDFTGSQTKINYDDVTGKAQLYMLVPFQDKFIQTGFRFNMNTVSWDLVFAKFQNS